MARPTLGPRKKGVVIGARFSDKEIQEIDLIRGSLTRSQWLRWVSLKERKEHT